MKLEGKKQEVDARLKLTEHAEHEAAEERSPVGSSGAMAPPPASLHRRKGIPRRAAMRS